MASKGFDLHAIASPDTFLEDLALRDGLTVHPVSISRTISPLRDLASLVRLYFAFRKLRPDILHLSTPKASVLGALAGWAAGVPVRIYLVRGLHSEKKIGLARLFFVFLERVPARLSTITFCVSPSLLEYARSSGILPSDGGIVLGNGMSNGVDVSRFHPTAVNQRHDLEALALSLGIPRSGRVVGFVGRLAADKGINELASAWKMIRTEFRDAHLLLVGKWIQEVDQVSESVRLELEQDPQVHLVGHVEDPAPYYALMSVFVLPSHGSEGWPNVLMEASSMALPVIATRVVGSVDAVLNGITGTLIPIQDGKALFEAVKRYLGDPDLCRRHGMEGRRRVVQYFRQEIVWEALYEEYKRLLERHGLLEPREISSPDRLYRL